MSVIWPVSCPRVLVTLLLLACLLISLPASSHCRTVSPSQAEHETSSVERKHSEMLKDLTRLLNAANKQDVQAEEKSAEVSKRRIYHWTDGKRPAFVGRKFSRNVLHKKSVPESDERLTTNNNVLVKLLLDRAFNSHPLTQ